MREESTGPDSVCGNTEIQKLAIEMANADYDLPLSPGNEEMEQDRASVFFIH